MSINDHVLTVEQAARTALFATGALQTCPAHGTTIRVGDEDAERHAYAKATNLLKASDDEWMRDEVVSAIADELIMAADDECPSCAKVMAE